MAQGLTTLYQKLWDRHVVFRKHPSFSLCFILIGTLFMRVTSPQAFAGMKRERHSSPATGKHLRYGGSQYSDDGPEFTV